jgi:hypothetical protein
VSRVFRAAFRPVPEFVRLSRQCQGHIKRVAPPAAEPLQEHSDIAQTCHVCLAHARAVAPV